MKNNLDILLIHPNAAHKIYQDLSKDFSAIEPPIWACMIASYLRKKGWNEAILDCEALRLNVPETVDKVKSLSPRLISMVVYGQQPSASTQNMVGATEIMRELAILDIPKIYVGPHPSALPAKTILDDKTSLVCQGEGPKTLEVLLSKKNLRDSNNLSDVPGLWYFDETSQEIKHNPPAQLILNLDEEIPDLCLDLLPLEKYRTANWHSWTNNNQTQPFLSLYTSLGCPFMCRFCMINASFNNGDNKNNTFRYWSPEHTVKILDGFAERGVTNVKIADEMFVLRPKHFLEICKLISQRGHHFNMWAYARVDTVKKDYLEWIKKAGINTLALGIESGNKSVRQQSVKGRFQEIDIKSVVSMIEGAGICASGNYIFGLPTDTLETMQETLDLALSLETSYTNMYCTMAYPGSQLHRDFSKNDPSVLPENNGIGWVGYSQHSYESFPLPTETLTNAQILKFRDEAFYRVFTNSEYINRMVKKFGARFTDEISRMLKIKLKRKIYEN